MVKRINFNQRLNSKVVKYLDEKLECYPDTEIEDLLVRGFSSGDIRINSYQLGQNLESICIYVDDKYDVDIMFGYTRFLTKLLRRNVFDRSDVIFLCIKYRYTKHGLKTYSNLSDDDINIVLGSLKEIKDAEARQREL